MATRVRKEHHGPEDEDTTYVYSRAEDRSFWMRSAAWIEKYKLLFWLVGVTALAAGFGFRTPQQAFGEIHAEIDSLKAHERIAVAERNTTNEKLDALIKLRCLEVTRTHLEWEAQLAGLNCENIIRGVR